MTPRRDPGARARAVQTATRWYANPAPPGRGRTSSGELMGRRPAAAARSRSSPGRGTLAPLMIRLRVRKSAAFFRVWWRAGFVKPKQSNVELVRTRRRRSVFLNVFKLNVCHVMPGGLQGRAIESHSITLVER